MSYIKIILKSLWKRKVSTLFMIIQLTVTIFILLSSFILLNSSNYLNKQAKEKGLDLKKTLHLKIYNANFSDDFKVRYNQLESYINNISEITNFGAFDFSNVIFSELENNHEYINIRQNSVKETFKEDFPTTSEILLIDNGIYQLLNLKIIKGSGLEPKDFYKGDQELTPILAGENFKDVIKIGQILTNQNNNCKYVLVGFIDKNSSWLNEQDYISNILTDLDNKFITPYKNSDKTDIPSILSKCNAIFYKVNNEENINYIKNIIDAKATLLNLRVESLTIDEDLMNFKSSIREILNFDIFFSIFLITLSCLGISTIMFSSILSRKREFGIRMSSGASISYLRKLIIGEVSFIAIISSLISLALIIGKNLKDHSFLKYNDIKINPMDNISIESIIFIFILMVIIIAITTFIPLKKLKKFQAKDLIGGVD